MSSMFRRLALLVALCCVLATPALAQFIIPAGGSFDVPGGATIDTGCVPVLVEGELSVNAGQFNTESNFDVAGTGVVNGNTGTLVIGGDLSSSGTFNAGSGTVELTDGCVGNTTQLSGTLVFENLVLSSTTGRTFVIPAGSNITVLGTLTLQGAPGQEIQLVSSGGGTAVITLGPGATVNQSFVSVAGNVQIGPAGVVQNIPTMSDLGLLLLTLLLGFVALRQLRRNPPLRHA